MTSISKLIISKRTFRLNNTDLKKHVVDVKVGYENLTGPSIPYYDFDNAFFTKKEQEDQYEKDFKNALDAVEGMYGDGCDIKVLSSCGYDPVKNVYKNSFHFRIRGAGYYACGKDIPLVDGCDNAPYSAKGKRQLIRLPYCSKEGNDRPLVQLKFDGMYWLPVPLEECDFDELIIQNVDGENLAPKILKADLTGRVDADNTINFTLGITLALIILLCGCLRVERYSTYLSWMKLMRCLKNIKTKHNVDTLEIAESISKKSNKYKEGEVENFFNREDTEVQNGLNIGSLCFWAKTDNAGLYSSIRNDNIDNIGNFQTQAIKDAASKPRTNYFSDYTQFVNAYLVKEDITKIYKYFMDSLVHIIDCGNHKIFTIEKLDDGRNKFTIVESNIFMGIRDFDFYIEGEKQKMSKHFNHYFTTKTFKHIDFIPFLHEDPTSATTFNLFQGYAINYDATFDWESKVGRIQPFIDHIFKIICNSDAQVFIYMMKYIRHLFERPAEKIGIAVLLQSDKQGSGKNMFLNMLMYILGDELYYKAQKIEDVCSKFNYHMQGKLLIQGDEIANYAGYKVADQLKAAITEVEKPIEPKGKDPYTIKSSERYMLTSNNKFPIRIDADDRRYFPVQVNESRVGDREYFNQLGAIVNSVECQTIFFHYLLGYPDYDLDKWLFRDIPCSAYKTELITEAFENPIIFLIDKVRHLETEENCFTSRDDLFSEYVTWCEKTKENPTRKRPFIKSVDRILVAVKKKGYRNELRPRGYYISLLVVERQIQQMTKNSQYKIERDDDKDEDDDEEDEDNTEDKLNQLHNMKNNKLIKDV